MTTVTAEAQAPATVTNPVHRDRLLAGLAEGIREQGFRATKISDIVRHAKTSRRTFYEHFDTKEDCYLALVRAENERIALHIAESLDPDSGWQERVGQAVRALADAAKVNPAIILSWIRELSVLGERGRELERANGEAFIELILSIADSDDFVSQGIAPPSRETALILLGGVRELIASTLEDGNDPSTVVDPAVAAAIALLTSGTARAR